MKMIEKHKKTYLYILFFLSFIFISLLIANKEFQNDTFYTIKVGEAITKYGIDMKDHFSFVPDLVYTYPHWLYDLIIYKLYAFGRYNALFISTIVLSITLSSVMFLTVKNVVNDDGVAFLLSALLTTFMTSFLTVRAQLVSYILLLLVLYSIEMIRKTNKNRYLVLAFISSILIVNMHCAVYYIIFVLFIPFLVSDLVYIIKNKFFKNLKLVDSPDAILEIEKPKNTKKLFIMMFLAILAGFIAPNAPLAFYYLPLQLLGESTEFISEHKAASIDNNLFLYIHLLFFLAFLLIPKVKIKLHDMFMIVGLFIASFMSIRSFSLYIVLTIFAYARISYKVAYDRLKYIKLADIYRIKAVYILVIVVGAFTSILSFYFECKTDYVNEKQYPVEMVKYIKENNLDKDMRVLNNYNFGSYLLLNDIKVFIDSRSDLYLPEFNKDCNQFMEAMNLLNNYKDMFEKYDFTHILIYKSSVLNIILEYRNDYRLVREDDSFMFYEKVKEA